MKALFRAIAFIFAVLTFVLMVVDGTVSIAGQAINLTSAGDLLARLGEGGALTRIESSISNLIHPFAWYAIRATILAMPAVLVTLVGAVVFSTIGRRREPNFDMRSRQ